MRNHATPTPSTLRDVAEDATDGYMIGVRETTDPSAWSLLFIEAATEDEQDEDLGFDTYCLVIDPGQRTSYGGVRECVLANGRLQLVLTPEAADSLDVPASLTFMLDIPENLQQTLRRGLRQVLTSGNPLQIPERVAV